MIGFNLEDTVNGEIVKRPKLMRTMLNIGLSAIYVLTTIGCDLFNKTDPVEKVTITNETPEQGSYTDKHKGETQKFSFDSNSELGLPLEEFYRVDGARVDNDSEYTHTFDRKEVTTIEGIAKTKEDSTKVTWMYTIDNQTPNANDKTITMDEESTKKIPESELGSDPDGDNLNYNVTSTSAGVDAQFKNGQLEITGLEDYFGNASVNYNVSDGEGTDNGTISVTINNTADNPNANAGEDKTGTINEEITLNSSSTHPDSPINNIIEYQWKALNGDVTITDSDKENANFTANTAGSYDVELTTTDNLEATDKDTMNVSIDSYKIIINTTNVLTDEGISGLEVMLAGKTVFTDANGRAELEYPTNATLSGNLTIQDENIIGSIGDFFNYSENIDITEDAEINIEMVPNVEFNSQFYDNIIDFLMNMNPSGDGFITYIPGEFPEDYPILVNTNESEMPADYYKQATDEAIKLINQTLGWEVFRETTGDDARYVFDYTRSSSRFSAEYVQKNDVLYIGNATVYITNGLSVNSFEILKGEITHELFTHGLGWAYHSIDSQDIGNTSVWDSDISTNEKNSKEIYLKLQGGTKLNNYQPE